MKKEIVFVLIILLSIFANAEKDISQIMTQQTKYLEEITQKIDANAATIQELQGKLDVEEVKKTVKKEPSLLFVFYLLGFNLLLIILVIVLLFFVYRRYIKRRFGAGEIHPVPKELTEFAYDAMKTGKKLNDIRMELAKKGWEPSMIEHAIDAAKEK